jgi:hypothetical protein
MVSPTSVTAAAVGLCMIHPPPHFVLVNDVTGYVVADVATAPVTSKSVKAHDHMFGAVQVTDDAALFLGDSGGNPVHSTPQRCYCIPVLK